MMILMTTALVFEPKTNFLNFGTVIFKLKQLIAAQFTVSKIQATTYTQVLIKA